MAAASSDDLGYYADSLYRTSTPATMTDPSAETTRKAMAAFHIALCISLLVGAFIASVSAALGGKLRDNY